MAAGFKQKHWRWGGGVRTKEVGMFSGNKDGTEVATEEHYIHQRNAADSSVGRRSSALSRRV